MNEIAHTGTNGRRASPVHKTAIPFLDARSRAQSASGDPGAIVASSAGLGWEGLLVERGFNSHFVPDNVVVPMHYFALLTSAAFTWEWKDGVRFKKHTMHPGQVWVNPAGVPFSHRITEYSSFILLAADPGVVEEFRDGDSQGGTEFRRMHNAQDPQLAWLIASLMAEAESGGVNGPLFRDTLLADLSSHFVRGYTATPGIDHARFPLAGPTVRRLLELIDATFSGPITLEGLAAIAGTSKFHFCRAFRKTFGVTPYRFVLERRLEKGMHLLARNGMGIAQAAAEAGFSDQSHFTRLFKRRFGVTPGRCLKRR